MVLEELLRQVKPHVEQGEAFRVVSQDTPVVFEANRLKRITTRESSGVALRIIKEGRIGLSSTSGDSDLQGLLPRALETLPFGPKAALVLPEAQRYPTVEVYDPGAERISPEQMVQLGQTLMDTARRRWPDVLWDCHVGKGMSTVEVLNTQGCHARYSKTTFSLGIEGTLIRDTDMLFVGDGHSSCQPFHDMGFLVDSLNEQMEHSMTIAPGPQGELPVIFTPQGVAGVLLMPLLAGFNGRNIIQGSSPLVGKLGQQLLHASFTLWDDPTIPYVPGSRICDDEGVPSQRLPLIHSGVIANFLYDLQTAAQAKTRSTGSASRTRGTLPNPGASVLVIEEGQTPYQEMVKDMKDGLIVRRFLGAGQGNVLGGDFSANVLLGYRVVNGEIVGRVKDTVVSGNVYRLLKEIVAISKETRWLGGYLRTPALYSARVHVASRR